MMFVNLGLFAQLLQVFGVNIFSRNETPKMEIIIIAVVLFVLNYFLFVDKGKYRSITKELKKESPKKRRTNTFILWMYVILSFDIYDFGFVLLDRPTAEQMKHLLHVRHAERFGCQ